MIVYRYLYLYSRFVPRWSNHRHTVIAVLLITFSACKVSASSQRRELFRTTRAGDRNVVLAGSANSVPPISLPVDKGVITYYIDQLLVDDIINADEHPSIDLGMDVPKLFFELT